MEAAQIINTITGTATITKIRSGIETKRGARCAKTTQTGDVGGMATTGAKTDLMRKDFCPEEELFQRLLLLQGAQRWTLL